MDYQNRVGSRFGGGGPASTSDINAARRERLRKLALETIDLDTDPYWFRNHLGQYECKLCLTVHPNDDSYLAHTQGRKHQSNLARRATIDAKAGRIDSVTGLPLGMSGAGRQSQNEVSRAPRIGRPTARTTKCRDPVTQQLGILFVLHYPEIALGAKPQYRIMSAFEQKIEPPDRQYQYVVVAAEPYESVGFKIQSREVDQAPGKLWAYWDPDTREYFVQLFFL